MPEEKPETGVKDSAVAAPTTETQPQAANPPAESTSVQPKEEAPGHIPYPRFKEINEKRKSLETEVAELRRQLAGRKEAPSENDPEQMEKEAMSKAVERLVQNGMNPQAAQVFAEAFKDISKKESKRYRAELDELKSTLSESQAADKAAKELSERQASFRAAHKDYAEYEDAMTKKWESLDEASQRALLASPKAYDLLYESAKAGKLEEVAAKGRDEGRREAYEGRSMKTAVSSTPGTSANPGKKYTAEDVAAMSLQEYKQNREKIFSDLGIRK